MSLSNTVTLLGNSTGYGLYSGNEVFNLTGYANSVLLSGANDTINVLGGEYDTINLNNTGFAGAVTDVINLGASAFNTITAGTALTASNIAISASGGPNTIALINHAGNTDITLGYTGNPGFENVLGLNDNVTLNGDAWNNVAFTAGGYAAVSIGATGDGFTGYTSSVALYGFGNSVTGGDEAFTITDTNGGYSSVWLGNGNNAVALDGDKNTVSLGNGNNTLAFSGLANSASFGTGNNTVTAYAASAQLAFAAGDAGANESLSIIHSLVRIAGGNENFAVSSGIGAELIGKLGNGNETIDLAHGKAVLSIGGSLANTADNTVTTGAGYNYLDFNGGLDTANLTDLYGGKGHDTVALNATLLGTSVNLHGALDTVVLTHDANAVINDLSTNGGLTITLDADATGGFGKIAITGLSTDDLAHINLVNASAYAITVDDTPEGGITLNFDHGSIDLVGLLAVPNNLIS